jgi:hypothetical protein
MLPKAIAHFVVPPPFIVLSAQPTDVLMLQLPEGVLSIAKPELQSQALITWRAAGQSSVSTWQADSPHPELVPPFLSLARAIGQWVHGRFEQGTEFPLDPAALNHTAPAIHEIFDRICEAWSEAYNAAAIPAFESASALRQFVPDFEVKDYQARVLLRLRADGSIAMDDEHDPFQLLLTIGISVASGVPRSRIAIGPPDFLVSGALHAAFIATLGAEGAFNESAELLGVQSAEDRAALNAFLESSSPSALVFRVQRWNDHDSDLIVYGGSQECLVVRADFQVSDNTVTYRSGSQKIIYSSLPLAKAIPPQPDVILYCLRLLTHLKDWMGVLQ